MASQNTRRPIDSITQHIYEYVRDYRREHKRAPTLREIGDACYISHTSVLRHIDKLEGMGWLEREPNIPRSMRLGDYAPDEE
ncbi:MarR family transcriptional regulator [Phototrophicus methaneseepsis]|uniref:MarR family transcriptional regulator n=1 Tax=Phototrophicus methaneseepsis TaxID=2710758 RepID=A0A7S8E9Q6_9CHLR|nr:MarR family transcriptional regulator [Phototrophicus methaneseepsis]QPC82990.1 MarR family transcriptional regulator [Phototrophicus methaneseepsis]